MLLLIAGRMAVYVLNGMKDDGAVLVFVVMRMMMMMELL